MTLKTVARAVLACFALAPPLAAVAAPATADQKLIEQCLAQKPGPAAAKEKPEGCVNIVRGPCLPDVPNNAEDLDCISREMEVWKAVIKANLADAGKRLPKARAALLQKSHKHFLASYEAACPLEEEGSMAAVEQYYCFMVETAKHAVNLREAMRP